MRSALKSVIPKSALHHFWHFRQSFKGIMGFYARDLKNLLRYGRSSPKAFQLILISPAEITSTLVQNDFLRTMQVEYCPVIGTITLGT